MPAQKGPRIDNSDLAAKLAVRRAALAAVAPDTPRVLDCFAGEGHMYQEIWREAGQYLGLEKRFSRPPGHPNGEAWRGDNGMLIARAMTRADWNIVDLDAYGSPWQMFRKVARASGRDRLAVTLTCGLARAMRTAYGGNWVREVMGAGSLSRVYGMFGWYDDIIRWTIEHCLRDTRFAVARARRVHSGTAADVWYWLLELERPPSAPAVLS